MFSGRRSLSDFELEQLEVRPILRASTAPAAPAKSVRISVAPDYFVLNDAVSTDFSSFHSLDNDDRRLGFNNTDCEDNRESMRKSVKLTSIFESIEEWSEDVTKSFVGINPIHRAILDSSWRGELNLLEEALRPVNPSQVKGKLNCRDNEGRTPLILASAFGNSQVVQFLIQNGADINIWDKRQKATPLACAAACGNSCIVSILIDHGVLINSTDVDLKTPLFWAVQSGSFPCVRKLLGAGADPNRNLKTIGTPLHVASALLDEDALPIMEILLEFKADVTIQEETTRKTCLHFATEEGNVECMELLLRTGSSCNVMDIRGSTALHIAANNCDLEALEILLAYKADLDIKDADGRTALHRVISKDSGAPECLIYLLENGAEVDSQDHFGHTPLHLAVLNDSAQIAGILMKYGSDITKRTKAGKDCLNLIVRRMPHVIRYIKESLDNAVSLENPDPNDPQCVLKLDFRPIITNSHSVRDQSTRKQTDSPEEDMHRETDFIKCLIETGHKSLLSHPLIEAFIVLKWERVRRFFLASLAFNLLMVLLYTTFVLSVYVYLCPHRSKENSSISDTAKDLSHTNHEEGLCNHPTENSTELDSSYEVYCNLSGRWYIKVNWFSLILLTIFVGLKEIFQMVQGFKQYLTSGEHWVQWLLLISVFTAIWPVPMAYECLQYWHYPTAAIGIFIAWSLMLVRVGKFPVLGVYIQMLGKVIKNFGVFIMAYACLLIAYTLSFCILFPHEPTFKDPSIGFITVLVMLAGELNYDGLFHNEGFDSDIDKQKNEASKVAYPFTSLVMFGCFVLTVSIILMNLLVGLAVNDIQSLAEGAKLDRLSRQTDSIAQLESFLFSKGLHAFLPDSIGKFLRRGALLVPSSYKWTFYIRPHDPRDNRLPDELQQDALRLATTKQFHRKPSNLVKKRSARGSRWNSQQKDAEMLQKLEGKIQTNLRNEIGLGFDRINLKIDELILQIQRQ